MRRHIARVHKRVPKTKKFWLPVLVGLLTLQSLAILLMWPKVEVAWKEANRPPEQDAELKMLIRNAVSSSFNDAVIDASQEKVYIPELRVYFPLNDKTRNLKYQFTPAGSNLSYPAEISLTTKAQTETLVENMEHVSCVQKMLRATVNGKDSERYNEKRSGEVTLSDGRTLYMFENKDKDCSVRWLISSPADMTEVLKKAIPY